MGEGGLLNVSVLYAEDEAITREEVLRFLRRRVATVFEAANGAEGMALFRRHAPDLVVTDIRMPVMDGLRMAREIRVLNRDIPIIVTTAYGDASYLMEAIEAGVDRYVIKPVEAEKLLAAIGKCAEVVEHRRAAQLYHEERERLVSELREALAKVKLLSGFLPICANCKRIRDDKGYWQQIEGYIRDHSEAEFSHGICPDCAKKLYGDYIRE